MDLSGGEEPTSLNVGHDEKKKKTATQVPDKEYQEEKKEEEKLEQKEHKTWRKTVKDFLCYKCADGCGCDTLKKCFNFKAKWEAMKAAKQTWGVHRLKEKLSRKKN